MGTSRTKCSKGDLPHTSCKLLLQWIHRSDNRWLPLSRTKTPWENSLLVFSVLSFANILNLLLQFIYYATDAHKTFPVRSLIRIASQNQLVPENSALLMEGKRCYNPLKESTIGHPVLTCLIWNAPNVFTAEIRQILNNRMFLLRGQTNTPPYTQRAPWYDVNWSFIRFSVLHNPFLHFPVNLCRRHCLGVKPKTLMRLLINSVMGKLCFLSTILAELTNSILATFIVKLLVQWYLTAKETSCCEP